MRIARPLPLMVCLGLACLGAGENANAPASHSVELQVAALSAFTDMDMNENQLKALRALVRTNSDAPAAAPADKGSAEYRKALALLRDAMIAGDDVKVADNLVKVDQLREDEHLDIVARAAITKFSSEKSAEALKLLSSSQIAAYLGDHGGDVPDAYDTIADALEHARGMKDAEFAAMSQEAAEQVGLLVAGLSHPNESQAAQKQVTDLLRRAKGMSNADFKSKHGELEKAARQIVGDVDGFSALKNWMQREMADLLSNPELPGMLDARLKHAVKS